MSLRDVLDLHEAAIIELIVDHIRDMKKVNKTELYALLEDLKGRCERDIRFDLDHEYSDALTKLEDSQREESNALYAASEVYAMANELNNYGTLEQKSEYIRTIANSETLADNHLEYPMQAKVILDGTLSFDEI